MSPSDRQRRKAASSKGLTVVLIPRYWNTEVSASVQRTLPETVTESVPVRSETRSWTSWEVKR